MDNKLKFINFLKGIEENKQVRAPYMPDIEIGIITNNFKVPNMIFDIIANSIYIFDRKTKLLIWKYYMELRLNGVQ